METNANTSDIMIENCKQISINQNPSLNTNQSDLKSENEK